MAVTLASIVTSLCSRVGLEAGDIDVTDLEDIEIEGYVVSRVMSVADALEPLRKVGFFDIVESDRKLKFVARGKPHVRTLTEDDIGAHDLVSDVPPAAVTTRTMQDVELPRQMRIHYRCFERDYEDDEQLSPTRLNTGAVNDVDIEIPVTMRTAQAAKVAEVLWADAWAGRYTHQTSLDHAHLDLDPADCIILPIDGRLERVRILAIDDSSLVLRKLEMARDDDGSYVSYAATEPVGRVPHILAAVSDTNLVFLDLPPLRTTDTDAGFYVAIYSSDSGLSWRGGTVYRSIDGGATYTTPAAVTSEASVGTLVNPLDSGALPSGSPTSWDDVNTITVLLLSGELESRSENDVLGGANHIAVGAHGRWEIIGFTTATQISATEWQLTHLLRGRRGTEHNRGAQAGDSVVLISGNGIARIPMSAELIGQTHMYRAVSIDQLFADGVDYTFAGYGQSLEPFSPSNVGAVYEANGDITISWTRRDRLGQELVFYGTDPESDAPASYEVDIYGGGSPTVVVRTLTSSTESVTYTLAQQAADFGSPTPYTTLLISVYKLSTVVGRGTPSIVTV